MDPQNPISVTPLPQSTTPPPIPTKSKSKLVIILIIVGAVILAIGSSIPFIIMQIGLFQARSQLGPDSQINTSGNTINIKTPGKTISVGQTVKLPTNFPTDIPEYPNSTLVMALNQEGVDIVSWAVNNGNLSQISDFYKNEMVANGWTEGSTASTAQGSLFAYTKGTRQVQLTINISQDQRFENAVMINIAVKN
ncbi:hypothetical protein HYS95_01070 [Candidatus Daviesbacteria bacterium]|nr:hypothetical protein [Candidatus Daviesbacteria bacterium]